MQLFFKNIRLAWYLNTVAVCLWWKNSLHLTFPDVAQHHLHDRANIMEMMFPNIMEMMLPIIMIWPNIMEIMRPNSMDMMCSNNLKIMNVFFQD